MIGQWYDDYVKSPPKVSTVTPKTAATTDWKVDKPQTVQGQIAGIVDSGSPLMKQAETRALQRANARGMLNSSMAVGAAQGAVYDAAMPIAQQDANTFARSGEFNASEANRTSQFNANAENQAGQFNAGETNAAEGQRFGVAAQFGLQDKQQQFQAGEREASQSFDLTRLDAQQINTLAQMEVTQRNDLIRMQEAFGFDIQKMSAQQINTLAQMSQQFKDNVAMTELQNKLTNENIPKQYAAQFSQQMFDRVSSILADPNLDPEAKRGAVQNAIDFANTSMGWVGKMYNVAFPGMTAPGGAAPAASTQGQQ